MKTVQEYYNSLEKKPNYHYIELAEIAREVGIECHSYLGGDEIPELKAYWGTSWICTDTEVGLLFYFLNDELICCSWQIARKEKEAFYFVSEETVEKLRAYIFEKLSEQEMDLNIEFIDWNEKVPTREH